MEKHLGDVPGLVAQTERPPFQGYAAQTALVDRDTYQAHCVLGNVAYAADHPQRSSLFLLNNILGGPGMNSRLNLNIREKYGFAYNIESSYTPYTDTGILISNIQYACGFAAAAKKQMYGDNLRGLLDNVI